MDAYILQVGSFRRNRQASLHEVPNIAIRCRNQGASQTRVPFVDRAAFGPPSKNRQSVAVQFMLARCAYGSMHLVCVPHDD